VLCRTRQLIHNNDQEESKKVKRVKGHQNLKQQEPVSKVSSLTSAITLSTMSNPYYYQSQSHQYSNFFYATNPDATDQKIAPSSNIIMPGQDHGTHQKRPRDDSPSENSWQKSFKRLRVMEEEGETRFGRQSGGFLNSVSVDEASHSEENPSGTPREGNFPQQAGFFTPHHHHHSHQGFEQQRHGEQQPQYQHHPYSLTAHHPTSQHEEAQVPGEGSSEENPVDYQPMNSLLGSLHRSRRRQLSGAGQSTDTSSHGNPEVSGMTPRQPQHSSSFDPSGPSPHSHPLETGTSTQYFRPAKKKSISLRVNSNLY
jgi:hypothetical protein